MLRSLVSVSLASLLASAAFAQAPVKKPKVKIPAAKGAVAKTKAGLASKKVFVVPPKVAALTKIFNKTAACSAAPSECTMISKVATATAKGAIKKAGLGGVSQAKVLITTKPLPVWRVYSSSRPHSRIGGWWSHNPPMGLTKAAWRTGNAVCVSWNPDADKLVRCTLKPGAVLAIGPGQSVSEASCGAAGESYPADTAHKFPQIFLNLPYDKAAGDYTAEGKWLKAKLACPDAARDGAPKFRP